MTFTVETNIEKKIDLVFLNMDMCAEQHLLGQLVYIKYN